MNLYINEINKINKSGWFWASNYWAGKQETYTDVQVSYKARKSCFPSDTFSILSWAGKQSLFIHLLIMLKDN